MPDDERLAGEAFGVNEIVLVTAPDDPLAKRRWVAVEELAGRPWLLREPGSGSRAMAEEWLRRRGLVGPGRRAARARRALPARRFRAPGCAGKGAPRTAHG